MGLLVSMYEEIDHQLSRPVFLVTVRDTWGAQPRIVGTTPERETARGLMEELREKPEIAAAVAGLD